MSKKFWGFVIGAAVGVLLAWMLIHFLPAFIDGAVIAAFAAFFGLVFLNNVGLFDKGKEALK